MSNINEQQIREIIREELRMMTTKQVFEKHIQIMDARHIQVGKTTGTKIGTEGGASGQKLGFFGTTPAVQQTGVAVTAAGIHAALVNLGLITS